MDEILFSSAHAALVFAFNYSGQSYYRPMMNRMADGPHKDGKGLSGLDGAAQAGFVRAEVLALGRLSEAVLVARIAPRTTPCPCGASCCSGHRANLEWTNAVAFLADHVRRTALFGCTSHGLLRREYVARHFAGKGARTSLESIADKYGVDRHTVSAHSAKVSTMFAGTPARGDKEEAPGLEASAMMAIEDRLRGCGMVAGDWEGENC